MDLRRLLPKITPFYALIAKRFAFLRILFNESFSIKIFYLKLSFLFNLNSYKTFNAIIFSNVFGVLSSLRFSRKVIKNQNKLRENSLITSQILWTISFLVVLVKQIWNFSKETRSCWGAVSMKLWTVSTVWNFRTAPVDWKILRKLHNGLKAITFVRKFNKLN